MHSGLISVLKPRWAHVLQSQGCLEEEELGMNPQQQQEGDEWVRAMHTHASALDAILWGPKREGVTQDNGGGGTCVAFPALDKVLHTRGTIPSPRLVEG